MKPVCILFSSLMFVAVLVTPQLSDAGAQHNKMKACNAEADAKGLSGEGKGDDRKAFMKTCLSAKPSQQDKMKACNKEAGDKKGDERKKFMSECLKA